MKILTLNCGSSSIKYAVFFKDKRVAFGKVERIGERSSIIKHSSEKKSFKKETRVSTYVQAFKIMINNLTNKEFGVIKSKEEINAVGHRVVHGKELHESIIIDKIVLKKIKKLFDVAPLHNPHNYKGIITAKKLFPKIPHVAVFDTAFHNTLPEIAYLYALPQEYYKKYGIRRYGFHGISHKYVAHEAAKMLKKPLNKLKIITCHLGAGSSITAINKGKSVDTSMGFTPLEGLIMCTRSGDVDPGLHYLKRHVWEGQKNFYDILNKKSGLLGISGKSKDMRVLWNNYNKDKNCRLAVNMYSYRLLKYLGSYIAVLNGVNAIVFTAGIGENAYYVRKKVCDKLRYCGVIIDEKKNKKTINGEKGFINARNSKVKILVIPTDEEKMIALETKKTIKGRRK